MYTLPQSVLPTDVGYIKLTFLYWKIFQVFMKYHIFMKDSV